ncbi:hypothetical protein ACJ5NV_14215 [Loktanella agnita]|uniref:hypothetical protein n=1 Tax=Loktanella agnita TaxID=287097 RepID=UPI0039862316
MIRLIPLILFVVALLMLFTAVFATMQTVASATQNATTEDRMPNTLKRVAYILLFILLIGLSTGWMGAA